MKFSTTLGLALVSEAYASIGPTADLFIGNKYISPDGFNRSTVLAGATESSVAFPGPLIKGNKGDTFTLNVVDGLVDTNMLTSTSIHWHGIFQEGSSWADGPVGINQCPIKSGDSFEYKFTVPDQAGTFWYHSHYSTQYCDGLRGPLVVYDPNDPYKSQYDFDDESTIITLADWYHDFAHVLGQREAPASPDSILINGKGRSGIDPTADLAVITVTPNKRYRFRLISISCDPNFIFSIDNHNMTIIEVDGENVQPLIVDSIHIFAGQRYSFILEANQSTSNYWIRSDPNLGHLGFDNGINSAILRYAGAPAIEPSTVSSISRPLLETNLVPLTNPAAPGIPIRGQADINLNFDISYNFDIGKFEMNNHTFVDPSLPVLLQILSGKSSPQELLPAEAIYLLPPNKVIEISMPGGSLASPHPMHLHGHTFSVIRSAGSDIDNYENPVRRDVVNIGSETTDNVTIRFVTDNAGPWTLHCHVDWHLDRGLSVVLAEDVPTIANELPPVAWNELCA